MRPIMTDGVAWFVCAAIGNESAADAIGTVPLSGPDLSAWKPWAGSCQSVEVLVWLSVSIKVQTTL